MRLSCVTAKQPMPTKNPEITGLRHCCGLHFRNLVLTRIGGHRAKQLVQFARIKAQRFQIHSEVGEIADFERKQFSVPSSRFRQLIVGEQIGALLRLRQMGELDGRHGFNTKLLGRKNPPVAGNDAIFTVEEYRVRETRFANRAGNERYLRRAVRPRIPSVRNEACDRAQVDALWRPDLCSAVVC